MQGTLTSRGRPRTIRPMRRRLSIFGWLFLDLVSFGRAADVPEEGIRSACDAYQAAFFSPRTDVAYLERLDGPQGDCVLEKPSEIAAGRVAGAEKPYGYGSGIEDVALANGLLLFALCDAHEARPSPWIAEFARRVFRGMKRVATLSPVPGFVPRGPHPDGVSYYRDSSVDQHTIFVCSLWRFLRSPLATDVDRAFIRSELGEFAGRMERNQWTLKVEDDSRTAHVGWDWRAKNHISSHILLSMLGTVADATGDPHWREEYQRFSNEQDGERWRQLGNDPTKEPRYTLFYNQFSLQLATIARVEQDPGKRRVAAGRLVRLAADMMSCNALHQWRRLDWIGEAGDAEVDAFLAPLGFDSKSSATVQELWAKFDPAQKRPSRQGAGAGNFEALLARPALIAWQTALLSRDPQMEKLALHFAGPVLEKVDLAQCRSGWLANHALVYLLLCIASRASA